MTEPTRDQKLEASRMRMAELAVRFLDRTDADIGAMRGALERLAAGDAAGIGEIRHLAHRMVGTGATLGFASLSSYAQVVEKLAEECPSGLVPDDPVRAKLESAVEALAGEYSRQVGRPGSSS
jgi:HPt (histidine-containing phosphotransfer) domain-containing protein